MVGNKYVMNIKDKNKKNIGKKEILINCSYFPTIQMCLQYILKKSQLMAIKANNGDLRDIIEIINDEQQKFIDHLNIIREDLTEWKSNY